MIKLVVPSGAVIGIIASILTYLMQDVVSLKTSIEVYNNSNQKIQELLIQTAQAHAKASLIGQKIKDTGIEVGLLKTTISTAEQEINDIVQKTKNSTLLLESNEQIEKIAKLLSSSEEFAKRIATNKDLPVGTILPAIGSPEIILKQLPDSLWVPADGRKVPRNSLYTKLTGRLVVPDLRGMFLRGLNEFQEGLSRSDGLEDLQGKGRKPGSFQADAFRAHHHHGGYPAHLASRYGIEDGNPSPPGTRYDFSDSAGPTGWKQAAKTNTVGGLETRPKNVSVFYYIKIN